MIQTDKTDRYSLIKIDRIHREKTTAINNKTGVIKITCPNSKN